ncbi:hypothetical protein [Psychrobacter celer]|uniref:hypothetical protein n=1 Tax=Psychrobacter celer TaxID=306572 RepID=UPI002FE4D234
MFNYLTIEQAIKYVSSKVEYEFLFDNLKDLEAFQIINPVFFFKGFAKFQCSDFSGNSEIGGYFCLSENESLISNKDILFEKCFLSEPALDYYDSFSDIEVCLDIEKEAKNSEKLFKWVRGTGSIEVNPYHYNFHLYNLDDDGNEIIKHEINLQDIRIKKYELDKWLSENSEQQRIVELQSELAQVKAQLKERTDTPADDNELSTRSQNLAAKIILALIDVAGLDKDSPPYQYDELNSNNRLIYDQIKANNMEVSQQKIGYWLDLASKQATDK